MNNNINAIVPSDEQDESLSTEISLKDKRKTSNTGKSEPIPNPSFKHYLTRQQVCDMLHISLPTLWKYTRSGLIKYSKIGRRVLYSEEAVVAALEKK
jgi:excisionase family DNA binding protein